MREDKAKAGRHEPPPPPGTAVTLEEVLITDQLARRTPTPRDEAAEHRALMRIARSMSQGTAAVLAEICDIALSACAAGSAGLSVLGADPAAGFCWDAMAGRMAGYVGGSAPRHHSPCGVTLDCGAPQLFDRPQRYFEWMNEAGLYIDEGLVVPLFVRDRPYGALWVVKHEPDHGFSQTEVESMTLLGGHVCAAVQLTADA